MKDHEHIDNGFAEQNQHRLTKDTKTYRKGIGPLRNMLEINSPGHPSI